MKPHKLKCHWSMDSQQDLRAMRNADAEKELTDMLAQEINAEIDAEILADLRNATTPSWTPPYWAYNMTQRPGPPEEQIVAPKKKATVRDITDDWEPSMWTEEVSSEPT